MKFPKIPEIMFSVEFFFTEAGATGFIQIATLNRFQENSQEDLQKFFERITTWRFYWSDSKNSVAATFSEH